MRALLLLQLQALTSRVSLSSSTFVRGKSLWFDANRDNSQVRRIWSSTPVCMGRRSSKIAGRKGAQDAKKAKLYSRIGKEVVYGYGGVSMVVEVSTDKIHRSVAKIREVIKDYGGKMADSGSVTFKFKRVRVVNIKATNADKDQLLAIALDAGAEDVIDPPTYEDDTEEDRYYKIVGSSENYSSILSKLREEGIDFEPDNGSELLPNTPVEVDDEAMDLNKELMSKLLELDDVDAVYTDQKVARGMLSGREVYFEII
ncbi:putative transcriptional regulatory protein [Glycine max]|nr:putative transcriptional regulatory protein [Glycine max]